jgi:hypothetical protein
MPEETCMKLVIEEPHQPLTEHPWNSATRTRFNLDALDIQILEDGQILWRGDIAYSLDDAEDWA